MLKNYYSQYGEDHFLDINNYIKSKGVFVDIGAGDPAHLSNTYALEEIGWTGLCVDADYRQIAKLTRHRKNVENFVVGTGKNEIEFYLAKCPDHSTILNHLPSFVTVAVPCISLEELLSKHSIGKIDLLTIDTEGTELDVCNSFDWVKHSPSLIIIEYRTAGRESNELNIKNYFSEKKEYTLIHKTSFNLIYSIL